MLDISVIILTYNEEKHIARCINNAKQFSNEIFIIDSFSNDKTVEIAKALGANVLQNKWSNNHAKQFNWALENTSITKKWIFRLDADEYLSSELIKELYDKIPTIPVGISGIVVERKISFLGKPINRGMIKMNVLRLFKTKHGYCENRWMDEHIVLTEGESYEFSNVLIDENLNTLGWWIEKHNNYSIREAIELLSMEVNLFDSSTEDSRLSKKANQKRNTKSKYARAPLFWRSFLYFMYRYFIKLGFIEGKRGFIWHFLQGWWYRTLVDAKIFEIKKHCGTDKEKIKTYIKENYQIEL